MNKADEMHLGKVYVDYLDAIESSQTNIAQTTDMEQAIIDGLGIQDGRGDELSEYKYALGQVILYAGLKGISLEQLMEFGESYKTLSFGTVLNLKSQVTIKEELDTFIKE